MHAVKEVEPLAPLGPLPSHVVDPEDHVLDVELHLHHGDDDYVNIEGDYQNQNSWNVVRGCVCASILIKTEFAAAGRKGILKICGSL